MSTAMFSDLINVDANSIKNKIMVILNSYNYPLLKLGRCNRHFRWFGNHIFISSFLLSSKRQPQQRC